MRTSLFKSDETDDVIGFAGIVTGTVVEVGAGGVAAKCSYASLEGADAAWARIEDEGGVSWTACVVGQGATMPVAVGQTVTAEHQVAVGDISPSSHGLILRAADQLVLYAADYAMKGLKPPAELSLLQGQQLCFSDYDEGCDVKKFEVDVEAGGAQGKVSPGEVATVGDYEVHLGAWTNLLDNGNCDSGSAEISLFVVPKP